MWNVGEAGGSKVWTDAAHKEAEFNINPEMREMRKTKEIKAFLLTADFWNE